MNLIRRRLNAEIMVTIKSPTTMTESEINKEILNIEQEINSITTNNKKIMVLVRLHIIGDSKEV